MVHFPRAFLVVIKGFAPPFWGIVIHFTLVSAVRRTVAEFSSAGVALVSYAVVGPPPTCKFLMATRTYRL